MDNITLLINGQAGRCVTDDPRPTFSIRKPGMFYVTRCAVALLDSTGTVVWESAVPSFQAYMQYKGPALQQRTEYTVRAELRGGDGQRLTAQAVLETGFLGTPWQAAWMEPEQENAVREETIPFHALFAPTPGFLGGHTRLRPCREVRKTFALISRPVRARVYASAHGIYSLAVNGIPASSCLLAPETSAYQKLLYYQAYNIAEMLQKGENTLTLTLADGWWSGRIGLSGDSCQYGDRLGFILQAEIALEDGSVVRFGSDARFDSRRSNIDYADLFIGQRTDFSRRDEPWARCHAAHFDTANLKAQMTAPVAVLRGYPPVYHLSGDGELIADFGVCLAGVADIAVRAEKGREVTLEHCEVLDAKGSFLRNILGRNKDQRDVFVCADGITRFIPRYTYHGFRYIRISGVCQEEILSLKACAIGTPLAPRGWFFCSDKRLNTLQAAIRRSLRSNMVSIPTDCPQREKAGWTGDILAFTPTGCFNYDLNAFLSAWLDNMRLEQLQDGEIPVTIPNYPAQDRHQREMGGNSAAAWSDACILVPWRLYQSMGDKRVLRDNLPMMERWLDYAKEASKELPEDTVSRSAEEIRWNEWLFNKGFQFGDWFIPSFVRREGGVWAASAATRDVAAACFHAVALDAYMHVLDALAESGPDSARLRARRNQAAHRLSMARSAVKACYVSENGRVQGDLQGLYVLILYAGILEGKQKELAAARLAELIEHNGDCLDTGFVSTPYLLDILADNGYLPLARRLLFQEKPPSWLYMVRHGATAIWENWEAVREDGTAMPSSFNHYALGCVGDFIYRRIGGVSALEPGYRKALFAPDINCGLASCACGLMTAYGQVSCRWAVGAEGLCRLELIVPQGTSARLCLNALSRELLPGKHVILYDTNRQEEI
jgi:alpha-L-rhamnosidase